MISPIALEFERDRAFKAVGTALPIACWPTVPVRWNRRLRRAGRAVIERRGVIVVAAIELSPAYFEVYPDDLAGILIHEAVHVGLAALSRPFGHGTAFRRACLAAGGRLHSRPMPGRVWRYRCPVCGETLERRRRPSGDRWCAPCVGRAADEGRSRFSRERALVLVGLRFSAGDVADVSPARHDVDRASPADAVTERAVSRAADLGLEEGATSGHAPLPRVSRPTGAATPPLHLDVAAKSLDSVDNA